MVSGNGLDVEKVSVSYKPNLALSGVSFEASHGSWVCVIGPNGAGKTTLLKSIAGLVSYSGSVRIDNLELATDPRLRAQLVSYLPQNLTLPSDMTVVDYVLLGRTPYINWFSSESDSDRQHALDAIDKLDVGGLANRKLGQLSGGESQKVALARTLCQQSKVLLLDEPSQALDIGHQRSLFRQIQDLKTSENIIVVSVLHDLVEAAKYSDSMLLLKAGTVVAEGNAPEVLTSDVLSSVYEADVKVNHDADGDFVIKAL